MVRIYDIPDNTFESSEEEEEDEQEGDNEEEKGNIECIFRKDEGWCYLFSQHLFWVMELISQLMDS